MRVVTVGGDIIEIGTTGAAPTISLIDYSRRETDDFGVTTVVKRGFARQMTVKVMVPTANVDALQRALAGLRATICHWVADDRYDSLSFDGFYKDFAIDLAIPLVSYCTLTIEGLADGMAVDPGIDPAPDRPSTLQLLQPVMVDDGMLASSSVAENDYPAWSAGATYPIGARVILASTHRIYESAAAGNVGNHPAGVAGKWIDIGPTNRWAMFDQALGSLTEASGGFSVTLDPGEAINAVALLDVTAATVTVSTLGYARTLAPAAKLGMVAFLDLPGIADEITITVAGAGAVSVGTLLIGRLAGLGITESAPTAGITDFSRKETDDFGDVTLVERAWAKRMSVRSMIRTDAIDVVVGRIANVRAVPSLWIGDASLESLAVYGFFKDFSVEVGEGDGVSIVSLSIEGLSAAAQVAPLVAPGDIQFPDGTDLNDLRQDFESISSNVFDLAALIQTVNAIMQAKTTLEGQAVGTVVVTVRTIAESAVEDLTLLGARNAAGTGWNLSMNTVYVDGNKTLAQRFAQVDATSAEGLEALATTLMSAITEGDRASATRLDTVEASIGGDEGLSARVEFLQSAVVDVGDGTAVAKVMLVLKANGRVGGAYATNTGELVVLDLEFDAVRMRKPDGTLLFEAGPDDRVYMRDVIVNTIEAESITADSIVANGITRTYDASNASSASLTGAMTDYVWFDVVMERPGTLLLIGDYQLTYASGGSFSLEIAVAGAAIKSGSGTVDHYPSLSKSYYAATPGTYKCAARASGTAVSINVDAVNLIVHRTYV